MSAIDKMIKAAAIEAATERFDAAVDLCRALDVARLLTPPAGIVPGPLAAHHGQVAGRGVHDAEAAYLAATRTASRYAFAISWSPSSPAVTS